MIRSTRRLAFGMLGGIVGLVLSLPSGLMAGSTDAQKCEAAKNTAAGNYAACILKVRAKASKTGAAPDQTDLDKCDADLSSKWEKTEAKFAAACPTLGDIEDVRVLLGGCSNSTADTMDGDGEFPVCSLAQRFTDTGLTIVDNDTGLEWEKKTGTTAPGTPGVNCDSEPCLDTHNVNNRYQWTSSGADPDGNAFTVFLAELNNCAAAGGFAGHCDWRLPTKSEIEGLLLSPEPCASNPCIIDPLFAPTASYAYWTSNSRIDLPTSGYYVWFDRGLPGYDSSDAKTYDMSVRAVRAHP